MLRHPVRDVAFTTVFFALASGGKIPQHVCSLDQSPPANPRLGPTPGGPGGPSDGSATW